MQPLLSVIVPVYNTEDRIEKCIRSIQQQTIQNIEIIVINDGSTDKSLEILTELQDHDERIHLFTYSNGGTGVALSRGLKNANGKYVAFCGADDWIEAGMYQKLISTIEKNNSDLVVCDIVVEKNGTCTNSLNISKPSILRNNLLKGCIHFRFDYSVCNKIFKNDFLKRHNIDFTHELRINQDVLFNLLVFSCINSVSIIPDPFYHYVSKEGSLMTSPQSKRIESFNCIIEYYHQFCLKNNKHGEWLTFKQHIGPAYQSYFFNLILKSAYTEKLGFVEYYKHVLSHLRLLHPLLLQHPMTGLSSYQKFKKKLLQHKSFRTFSMLASMRHKSF